jgi:hypothetical protein
LGYEPILEEWKEDGRLSERNEPMRQKIVFVIFVLMGLVTSCGPSERNGADTGDQTKQANHTYTAGGSTAKPVRTRQPSYTVTASITPSITPASTITLTATPPPNLEFYNMKFSSSEGVIGEIKNNTGQTMTMSTLTHDIPHGTKGDPAFWFYFDYYEDYNEQETKFEHKQWGPVEVGAGGGNDNAVPCILYPGEHGVAMFFDGDRPGEGLYETLSIVPTFPGPPWVQPTLNEKPSCNVGTDCIGYLFYQYESRYIPTPDLGKGYHLPAENVIYKLESKRIYFEFDVDIPQVEYIDWKRNHSNLNVWVSVFDQQDQLEYVFHRNLIYSLPLEAFGAKTHIKGFKVLSGPPTDAELNNEDGRWETMGFIEKVNEETFTRIEVLIEFPWDTIERTSPCNVPYE